MYYTVDKHNRPRPVSWDRELWKDYDGPAKIYIFDETETIIDNLRNRRSRPYTEWRKNLIPDVLERTGLSDTTKVRWSQKAGCGCSPGFIILGERGFDIFVHLYDSQAQYIRLCEERARKLAEKNRVRTMIDLVEENS